MISKEYYNRLNILKTFFNGVRVHYGNKERYIIIRWYDHPIAYGEDMYSLARKIFGDENEYLWPVIADLNPLRDPTDWEVGDIVKIPEVILSESTNATFKIPINAVPPTTKI